MIVSLLRWGKTGDGRPRPWWRDLLAVVAGTLAYAVVLWLRPVLFGATVI